MSVFYTVDLSLFGRGLRRSSLVWLLLAAWGAAGAITAAEAQSADRPGPAVRAQEPTPAPPPKDNPPPENPSPPPNPPPGETPPAPPPNPPPSPGTPPPGPGEGTPPAPTNPPQAPPGPPVPATPPGATPAPAPAKPPAPPPRPGDVETQAGLVALQGGDLGGARLHFEKALAVDPGHPIARSRMAYLKFRSSDFAGAANDAGIATTADPSDALSLVILGRAQEALGAPEKAASAYTAALPLSKTAKSAEMLVSSALAHYLRAMQHIRKGETTDVEDDLKELLRIYPKNAYGLYELGSFYVRAGRKDEAIEVLKRAGEAAPEFHPQESWIYPNRRYTFLDVNLRFWLGVALRDAGRTDEAITELEAVTPRAESLAGADITKQQSASTAALEGTIDRSFTNVHYEAALAHQKKGDTSRASALLKMCLRLGIADADTLKKARELQKQLR